MDMSGALMIPPSSGELLPLTTAEGGKVALLYGLEAASLLTLHGWQHIHGNMENTNWIY